MSTPRSPRPISSREYGRLLAVFELVLSSGSLDHVIQAALDLLRGAVPCDSGAFYWWDVGGRAFRWAASLIPEPHGDPPSADVPTADDLVRQAAADGMPLRRNDAALGRYEIAAPAFAGGVLIGVFSLHRGRRAFRKPEFELIQRFVCHASIAIENARRLRQMRQSEEQYRSLFDACLDVVYMTTPGGLFLDVNPAGQTLFGQPSREDLLMVDIASDLYEHVGDRDEFKRVMADQGFVRDRESRLKRLDGQVLTVLETATTVRDETGTIVAYRGILRDITERKRAEDALAYQAVHDSLTGLPNRSLLQTRMQQAMSAARLSGGPMALMIMDLDHFKEVNDTLGHAVGDELLVEVARRLRSALRSADTVARLGGDEFAVVLPGADVGVAQVTAARILAAVQQPLAILPQGIDIDVRGSIGMALYPQHGLKPDELLRRADVAMYVAKRTTSGTAMYELDQDEHSPTRLALVGELRRALGRGDLVLHYQPQVALATGDVVGVEALVRWQHPQRGLIAPDDFIPLAERTGLIRPLTDWVIETALAQSSAWHTAGLDLRVAVNLSVRDLQEPRLPDMIAALVAAHHVDPRMLKVEITESVLMADRVHGVQMLARLRAIGVEVAIDDFGTGYSSLAYLAELPIDEIKIDRSFVSRIRGDQRHVAIVRSTVELAHSLGMGVIAEGAEDSQTVSILEDLGCDVAQGYYFARPMPATDLVAWLRLRTASQAVLARAA